MHFYSQLMPVFLPVILDTLDCADKKQVSAVELDFQDQIQEVWTHWRVTQLSPAVIWNCLLPGQPDQNPKP